jgi:hypothetical protein
VRSLVLALCALTATTPALWGGEKDANSALSMIVAQKRIQEANLQRRRARLKSIESFRSRNPEVYEREMRSFQRHERIESTVREYRSGALSEAAARKRLTPDVAQSSEADLASVPQRISRLQQQLDFLRKVSRDKNVLITQRLDALLAKPDGPGPPKRNGPD